MNAGKFYSAIFYRFLNELRKFLWDYKVMQIGHGIKEYELYKMIFNKELQKIESFSWTSMSQCLPIVANEFQESVLLLTDIDTPNIA